MGFKTKAMVHSLKDLDEVEIVEHEDNNHVKAIYGSKFCTAVYNVFTGLYYVDDVYGVIIDNMVSEEELPF